MKRIIIFPNDRITAYYKKKEIKARYFNPCDLFDEVHIVSFGHEDVSEKDVQAVAGNAALYIHSIPSPLAGKSLIHFFKRRKELISLLSNIRPDVIRAYNAQAAGFLAVYAGRRLNVPSIISLHIDGDERRQYEKGSLRQRLRLLVSQKLFEPHALSHASSIICVTHFLRSYARKYGATHIDVIYNKVYTVDYFPNEDLLKDKHRLNILTVGRLDPQKNQECIIRAVKDLAVSLTLIGDGQNYEKLRRLTKDLKIEEKVRFIRSVPNKDIPRYYREADVFAIASFYEGFCIPVLEAMAAGLPVVVNEKEPLPEVLGESGLVVKNDTHSFSRAFKRLMSDKGLRKSLGEKARKRAETIDGSIMEKKEADVYKRLMKGKETENEEPVLSIS